MKPLIYKGLRLGTNKTEWVSSDEIKQSYSQIRLLAVQNDNYAWIPIADGTLCRGSEAKDVTGKRIFIPRWGYVIIPSDKLQTASIKRNAYKVNRKFNQWARKLWMYHAEGASLEK